MMDKDYFAIPKDEPQNLTNNFSAHAGAFVFQRRGNDILTYWDRQEDPNAGHKFVNYARYFAGMRDFGLVKVQDQKDALDLALQLGADKFEYGTYVERTFKGRQFLSPAGEMCKPVYIADEILSRDKVVEKYQSAINAKSFENDEFTVSLTKSLIESLMHPDLANNLYVKCSEDFSYEALEEGNEVYNSNGMRLFPPLSGGLAPEDAPEI